MTTKETTAEALVRGLKSEGISRVFGHPGGEVVEIIDMLARENIEFILTGHEGPASMMAQVTGRLTNIPGACLSTLGPGTCNLTLGIASAYLDRDPMIAISARTAKSRETWSNKQNLPLNDMMAHISKNSIALNGVDTRAKVREAIANSKQAPFGSIFLTIQDDVAGSADQTIILDTIDEPKPKHQLDKSRLLEIAKAVSQAEKPVAVIGSALKRQSDRPAIDAFLSSSGIPFTVSPQGKGMADETLPNYLGAVASAAGDAPIVAALQSSDCILGLGFDAVESGQSWHHPAPVYILGNAETGFGDYTPVECIGDVSEMIRELIDEYSANSKWTSEEISTISGNVTKSIIPEKTSTREGLSPAHVIRALQKNTPSNTICCTDVGAHKLLVTQAWKNPDPVGFLVTNGLSGMGFGIPAAIASHLAFPERPVIAIVGDGSLGMVVQELETAKRIDAPILVALFCDQALSVIKVAQDERELCHRGVTFTRVDWTKVAEGFGFFADQIDSFSKLEDAVKNWSQNRQPTLLAIDIDPSLYRGLTY